jgi:uncharacterized repeat protein (TIGR03803 family)
MLSPVLATVCLIATAATASSFSSVYSFTGINDGGLPVGGVATDTSGNVFGTTSVGGSGGQGTIFEYSSTGQFLTLFAFNGGSTGGVPQSTVLVDGQILFGTTTAGGMSGRGTLYSFNLTSKKFATLHAFSGSDGSAPKGNLWLQANGTLVGTTYSGGAKGLGEVYTYSIASKKFTVLYSFAGGVTDGANPAAGVTEDSSGNIYGTTYFGGAGYAGTVYKISGPTETLLLGINAENVGIPTTEPTLDTSGNLYVSVRGVDYFGDLIQITPEGNHKSISSLGVNGSLPNADGQALASAPLIIKSALYTTCSVAGSLGYGTIASVSLASGYSTVVIHSFAGTDGYQPSGKLAQTSSGTIFGTTSLGGAHGSGTIYKFAP